MRAWALGVGLGLSASAVVHAKAERPAPLIAERGCERFRGVPIGANDATQVFELMVCTTDGKVTAKVQTSSLVSGWSVRQSVGSWDASGRTLTLKETEFLESRPEPGWQFCLIEALELERTATGLSGTYVSTACDDRAELVLDELALDAGAPTPEPKPAEPKPAEPKPAEPALEPTQPPGTEPTPAPTPEPSSGCTCATSNEPAPLSGFVSLALLGIGLTRARARTRARPRS